MVADASHIAVVVLAAGASNRMGSPKQLLDWGAHTNLLEHAIETASAVNSSEVIVVLGANFEKIKSKIKAGKVTILENKNWRDGLGSSIACAADYVLGKEKKNILITLADQPFITAPYLSRMISNFELNKHQIVASSYQHRPYAVPALFDASYLEKLSKLSNDHGARFLIKTNESSVKTLKPPQGNPDIDTPEDYKNYYLKNN